MTGSSLRRNCCEHVQTGKQYSSAQSNVSRISVQLYPAPTKACKHPRYLVQERRMTSSEAWLEREWTLRVTDGPTKKRMMHRSPPRFEISVGKVPRQGLNLASQTPRAQVKLAYLKLCLRRRQALGTSWPFIPSSLTISNISVYRYCCRH